VGSEMNIELLPMSRWGELQRALDESRCEDKLPKPAHSIMLAATEGESVVGCIGAERVWCVSPLWLDKTFRGNGLAMDLVKHLELYNTENLTEYAATSSPHVEKLIYSIGFIPTVGQMWRRERG